MPFFYYPTVNTDTDPITPETARRVSQALASPAPSGRKAILYLHVPFCRTHCSYCFYNIKVVKQDDPAVAAYTDAIIREIEFLARSERIRSLSIEHIFIGGGTPSMLPDHHLARLLEALQKNLNLTQVQDFSIEMNLETMTPSNLAICRELGVSRVSFGWQTSSPRLRKMLALIPDEETLAEVCDQLARFDYPLIWDLMYALPGQTMEEWDDDLSRSIESGIASVDIHRCDVVPPAPLYDQVRSGRVSLPSREESLEQYRHAWRRLTSAGYEMHTFQQFNRPEVPSAYSHYGRYYYRSSHDMIAIGPGAIGVVADWAYMNARDLGQYIEGSTGEDPVFACACEVDDATWQERDFVLGLGQLWNVPKSLLREELSAAQKAAIEKLVHHGALIETETEFRLTEEAIGYHFSVANEFVTPRQFSRNVGYLRAMPGEIVWRRMREAAQSGSA